MRPILKGLLEWCEDARIRLGSGAADSGDWVIDRGVRQWQVWLGSARFSAPYSSKTGIRRMNQSTCLLDRLTFQHLGDLPANFFDAFLQADLGDVAQEGSLALESGIFL